MLLAGWPVLLLLLPAPNPRHPPLPLLLQTYWHSSSHLLGQALELEFGVDLTIGPALEEGFYYDCYMGDRQADNGSRDGEKRGERGERKVVGGSGGSGSRGGSGVLPLPPWRCS